MLARGRHPRPRCATTSLWEDSVDHVYGLTTGDYKEHVANPADTASGFTTGQLSHGT